MPWRKRHHPSFEEKVTKQVAKLQKITQSPERDTDCLLAWNLVRTDMKPNISESKRRTSSVLGTEVVGAVDCRKPHTGRVMKEQHDPHPLLTVGFCCRSVDMFFQVMLLSRSGVAIGFFRPEAGTPYFNGTKICLIPWSRAQISDFR